MEKIKISSTQHAEIQYQYAREQCLKGNLHSVLEILMEIGAYYERACYFVRAKIIDKILNQAINVREWEEMLDLLNFWRLGPNENPRME